MKNTMILDLTNVQKSGIKYKLIKYPDSQQNIVLLDTPPFDSSVEVTIKARLRSFTDLELIIAATHAVRDLKEGDVHLLVPYFLGARSDRKLEHGSTNYLKNVICPIINLQNYKSVTVVDPHSDVLEACLNNFKKANNFHLVEFALSFIKADNKLYPDNKLYLVSPDAGAIKKIYDVAEKFNIYDIKIGIKHRNVKTGEITHTEVPGLPDDKAPCTFLLIDDICDGGKTYVELAKVILEKRPHNVFNDKMYLVISHGIFSKGLQQLAYYYDQIFVTDSYHSYDDDDEFSIRNGKYMSKMQILKI